MTTGQIIEKREELEKELRLALATMARKDDIYRIKKEMLEIQNACSHIDHEYNWTIVDNFCPYCGKKIY